MYERFTDRARKAMTLANQLAIKYNHEFIGTEHVLLGLLTDSGNVAIKLLRSLDVRPDELVKKVEDQIVPDPPADIMGKVPQTPRTKKVIQYAIEEARRLENNWVGTEHLLLGLAREKEGLGGEVLLSEGLNLESLREVVKKFQDTFPQQKQSTMPEEDNNNNNSNWRVGVYPTKVQFLHPLVVKGVTEHVRTVAEGLSCKDSQQMEVLAQNMIKEVIAARGLDVGRINLQYALADLFMMALNLGIRVARKDESLLDEDAPKPKSPQD
jgi:ATP-dependent Clp protease ATP-binding subunit ClpA